MPRDLTNEPQSVGCSDPLDMCYFATDAAPWPSMQAVAVFRITFHLPDPLGRVQWMERIVSARTQARAVGALQAQFPGARLLTVTGP